jgi:hypothetical protein
LPPPSPSRGRVAPASGSGPPPATRSRERSVKESTITLAAPPSASSLGALAAGPPVVLHTEAGGEVDGAILREVLTLRVAGVPAQVRSITFARSPAEAEQWTEIKNEGIASTFTSFNTKEVRNGLYDLRVIVTDAEGGKHEATLRDRLIANNSPPIVELRQQLNGAELVDLGANLGGEITLAARVIEGAITSASFEWKRAGEREWHPIATTGAPPYTASFDTTTLQDGHYDFRVVPEDETGQRYASIPVRGRLVDNTAPSVELVNPGPQLSGRQVLSAVASDAGSGVALVSFERARAGSSAWHRIGEVTRPPYSHALNTESLQNGLYDLRATAIDSAGNRRTSAVIAGIAVNNPTLPPVVSASITSVVAPAQGVTILGAVGGGHPETWAYGFTSAPPAVVNGETLPYTASGRQLVLLRYTEEGGWQIADVLRNPGGVSAFELLPKEQVSTNSDVRVTGGMTPDGEAWLWLAEESIEGRKVFGLFHRRPGGRFELDRAATEKLEPQTAGQEHLLSSLGQGDRLRLTGGQSEGQPVFGMLTAANNSQGTGHEYALLREGAWERERAPSPPAPIPSEETMTLLRGDIEGRDTGWGVFTIPKNSGRGLILGHLQNARWNFSPTGLDALDLTGSLAEQPAKVEPEGLKADGAGGVWVEARVNVAGKESGRVVAHLGSSGRVMNSWCTLTVANECEEPLDLDHPAAVPDAIFNTGNEQVALAAGNRLLHDESVHVFARGQWRSVPAAGHEQSEPNLAGGDAFTSPNEGWLGGASALGRWSTRSASGQLASWPLSDRSPLTAVALAPGGQGRATESGALTVGLDGTTMSYDSSAGWLVQATPQRAHHVNLLGVAFAGPSSAFAVGQFGLILHWNGSAWSEDPQSFTLTESQLNAVAFGPTGEGWAVGTNGTILHYNGRSWSVERPPSVDAATDITSVAVAGSEVFAVAGGRLIQRLSDGSWQQVTTLPSSTSGRLRLVAGLPDGGVTVAGSSVLLHRQAPGQAFDNAPQPLQGIAVALAPFRQADSQLGAYVSIAPPASGHSDVGGFPPGDGELLRETAAGWRDLSGSQFAGNEVSGDGSVKSDPVLAVATGPDGEHAWAVGGYAGTVDAAAQGTSQAPSSPSVAEWKTASVWRYDATGSAGPPALTTTTPSLPAKPGAVSFAFFTSPMCRVQCSAVTDAQPDVNLTSAGKQMATFATQPGGPAFAMLGGNARGPVPGVTGQSATKTAIDFAHLPGLLAALGGLPTFAALGPRDYVGGPPDETQAWAEAFAESPTPFGSSSDTAGITPVSSGASTPNGLVHRYYSFDAHQNGGVLRVIVLDNSKGSLEGSSPGQTRWLEEQLADAHGTPVVAVTALPLHGSANGRDDASDGRETASLLARAGVLAVFTTNPSQLDERFSVPQEASAGTPTIPEYEGASLGYQQGKNNGVKWYLASIDTRAATVDRAAAVNVAAIPVVSSLSLKPLDGLSVARSLTLRFDAVGRRPPGTLATRFGEDQPFPGYDNYVDIPAPSCEERPCVQPSYAFRSSDPTIGDFVVPSAAGSQFPKLDASGHPIPSSDSGLFCAYNSGSTTVSITAGLLSYSLPVTVKAGGFGAPCGTVYRPGVGTVVIVHNGQSARRPNGAGAPPAPPPAAPSGAGPAPAPVPPPPAPHPPAAVPPPPPPKPVATPPPPPRPPHVPAPHPAPPEPPPSLIESAGVLPVLVPPVIPAIEPVPPGAGGFAQSPAAAKRREEARKHASQSAFTIRPSGAAGAAWFYLAVGLTTLLALALSARALPARPRARPALLLGRTVGRQRPRSRG